MNAESPLVLFLLLTLLLSAESIRIGFTQRSQTVSEADIYPEALGTGFIDTQIHADQVADKDYAFIIEVVDPSSDAIFVLPIATNSVGDVIVPDAQFGIEFNGTLQEERELRAGRENTSILFTFWNDYYVEEEECFTVLLSPSPRLENNLFSCTEDESSESDYFCQHTLCIADNDKDARFSIGFESEIYTVTEGGRVNVCAGFIVSQELQNAIFGEVFVNIIPSTIQNQPVAEYKVDYQFTFDMGVPLTNMTRRLCIDVGTIEDMVLEEMEIATLLVYIDFGSNVTATIPITCIFIIDNDEASIGLEKSYYDSNEEICIVLEQVSEASFIIPVILTVHTEQTPQTSYNKRTLSLEVAQTRACFTICSVVTVNSTFEVSLSKHADLEPRVQLALNWSTAEVKNIRDDNVGIGWGKSNYTARGLANMTACLVVYSTLSVRSIDLSVEIISDRGTFPRPGMSIESALGERMCVSIDVTEAGCNNFILRVSSDDQHVCIPDDSTNIIIDANTTRCAPITVGYEMREYQTPAANESAVELCAVITSPSSNGFAVRAFVLVATLQTETRAIIQNVGNGILQFETNDTRQCYRIYIEIPADEICNNFSSDLNFVTLHLLSGDGVINVEPSTAVLAITDSTEPECAPITVGYEMREYQTPAANESAVELCAMITSPSSNFAVRAFALVATLQTETRAIIQNVGNGILQFETNDTRQCYRIYIEIPADEVCNDFSRDLNNATLHLLSGDGVINVEPSTAVLAITDSTEPECAPIKVGYTETSYTVSEGEGVIVCVEITSHPVNRPPRPFSLTLMTENGTADSENDFIPLSADISYEVGGQSHCQVIFTVEDEICELSDCKDEYFLSFLSTKNHRVYLDPSETTITIEETRTENCSELFADPRCRTDITDIPSASPADSNNNRLLYVYISVPLATGMLFVITAVSLVVMSVYIHRRKKKRLSISLPRRRTVETIFVRNTVFSPESKMIAEIQLKIPKQMRFLKDHIHLSNVVGQGESGIVYKALLNTQSGKELVAVKTVKALFASSDISRLIKEISVMLSFNHPNVMTLRGVCLDQESPLLIMPFMSNGSVLEYVRKNKVELMYVEEPDAVKICEARVLMLRMCHHIAKGMQYLTEQGMVHRDLAARNCMIDMNGMIKVTDFGLTEYMRSSNYFRKGQTDSGVDEKMPIRWMAPESIDGDLYTEKTDVWSYGVTCWEVFTCGQIPYHGIAVRGLFAALNHEERLDKPKNLTCTYEIFSAIRECWHESPDQRPTFINVVQKMSALLEEEAGYVDLLSSANLEQQAGVVDTKDESNDQGLQRVMQKQEIHLSL